MRIDEVVTHGKLFAAAGAILAMLAVALGAFGAHGLRARLEPRMLEIFETAVRYQMYHALGLFAVAWVASQQIGAAPALAGWLIIAGTIVFSGSLYMLALSGVSWLGAITPLGGIALIAGWAVLGWSLIAR